MASSRALFLLVLFGLLWASSLPLIKLAVSGGHHPLGLIFWQLAISFVVTGGVLGIRRKLPRYTLDLAVYCLIISLLGTVLPNSLTYLALSRLPAGIVAILVASVPMFSLLIALVIRAESFRISRFAGVLLGAVSVVILSVPDASLPVPDSAIFLLVALAGYFCYGVEGNYVAWRSFRGYNPMQVIFGASLIGALMTGPIAWSSGIWVPLPGPWEIPEKALILSALIHAFVYVGYIWLVGETSAVFASQIAYVVTLGGVFFSALFLGEEYSSWAYLALACMIAGLFLVQPLPNRAGKPR